MMVQSIIDNRYRVIAKVREGGMGCVYEAEHAYTKRLIALKVIHQEFQLDTAYRERFLREIELACRVQHPHAVQILDAGEAENGMLYMAMEYLEGETLGTLLERCPGGLGLGVAIYILHQLGSALDAIHAEGLIHRDLKPDNIMILKDGTHSTKTCLVKLLDFGIARQVNTQHSLTGSHVIGTPEFMSPEQTRGEKLNRQSDIYNLGLIAYSMLTGNGPFSSDTPFGYVFHHNMTPVPSLSTIKEDLPKRIDQVIQKALAKEAGERFCSALEFIELLERAATHSPSKPATLETKRQDPVIPTLVLDQSQKNRSSSVPLLVADSATSMKYYKYGKMGGLGLTVLVAILSIVWMSPANVSEAFIVGRESKVLTGETKLQDRMNEEIREQGGKDLQLHSVPEVPVTNRPTSRSYTGTSVYQNVVSLPESNKVNQQIKPHDSPKSRSIDQTVIEDSLGAPALQTTAKKGRLGEQDMLRMPLLELSEHQRRREDVNRPLAIHSLPVENTGKAEGKESDSTLSDFLPGTTLQENKTMAFRVDEQGVYTIPDELANVRGGMSWLRSSIRYPGKAMRANVSGAVIMRLMIDENGRIKNSSIIQSIGFGCEEEVMRVLKRARFTPGKVDNQPVKSWLTLKFHFDADT